MIKGWWLLFIALLVHAHLTDVNGGAVDRPLSEFRDFQPQWVGQALFGVLLLFGVETVRAAFRADAATDGATYLAVTGLLSIVAITPSDGILHNICAVVAMLMMHFYFAILLYHKDLFSLFAMHIVVPFMILFATKAQSYGMVQSYGIWQKGMILYFLSATVIQQEFWPKEVSLCSLSTDIIQHGVLAGWIRTSKA